MQIRRITRSRRSEGQRTGAATVELALVSPILLIFLLGIIDAGQYANCYQTISNASREGARIASRSGADQVADVQTSVMQYLSTAFPNSASELASHVTISISDESGNNMSGAELATVTTGEAVQVTVSMEFDVTRLIPGLDAFDNRVLETSTIMRRE